MLEGGTFQPEVTSFLIVKRSVYMSVCECEGMCVWV